jgi:hypothetical protein
MFLQLIDDTRSGETTYEAWECARRSRHRWRDELDMEVLLPVRYPGASFAWIVFGKVE